jgi:hypothetical protein
MRYPKNPDYINIGDLVRFPMANVFGIQYSPIVKFTKNSIGLVVSYDKSLGAGVYWCMGYHRNNGVFRLPLKIGIDDFVKVFRFRGKHEDIRKKIITGALVSPNKHIRELIKVYNFIMKNRWVLKCGLSD